MINKLSTILLFASVFISAGCCSSHRATTSINASQCTQDEFASETSSSLGGAANKLDFVLTNLSGARVQAVYISPTNSPGWEENVLGDNKLDDGDSINIKFDPAERAILWDLRVEGPDRYFAEWKCINLRTVSKVTLHVKLDKQAVGIAEIE